VFGYLLTDVAKLILCKDTYFKRIKQ